MWQTSTRCYVGSLHDGTYHVQYGIDEPHRAERERVNIGRKKERGGTGGGWISSVIVHIASLLYGECIHRDQRLADNIISQVGQGRPKRRDFSLRLAGFTDRKGKTSTRDP